MSEIIKGSIVSYIYKSEDSLYKVAKIETTNNKEEIIVGSFIELEEGLEYEFVGNFVEHAKYGRQFKIDTYNKSQSFSKEGLINYLSSDKFFGIGKKLATNIVDELGIDCIKLIMDNPDCLNRVHQMTENRKKVIVEVIKENYASEQVFIKLFSYGLTSKMIYRLFEVYGLESATRIEENPYSLIYDVEGFGFRKSDDLALRLGFKENDKLRLQEAIKYTLNAVCYQQGFTFLTENQLINSTYNLLNNSPIISNDDLDYALESLVISEKIIKEEERYYEPILYKSELKCVERIHKLKNYDIKTFPINKIKEAIQDVQKDLEICYTDLQEEAIIKSLSSKLSIITGGPGTGKSTIINGIMRVYAKLCNLVFPSDELDVKISMMAPTGRAAKRMTEVSGFKSTTIHKALGYNYEGGFSLGEDNPLSASLIIIDEASMIDINLASALLKSIPLKAQVIFVGDVNQLPSVGPGNVFSDIISSNLFSVVRLFEIMRQAKDSNIIKLSNMIQSGRINYSIFSDKKEVYFYPCEANNLKNLLYRILDSYVEKGNGFDTSMQLLIPMYAGIAGIDAVNEAITNRYNHQDEKLVRDNLILKKNDRVLQLKNDPDLKLMNGDIGTIKGITQIKEKDVLLIDFDGKMITYPAKEVDNLRLAYAISIHKSQGSGATRFIVKSYNTY